MLLELRESLVFNVHVQPIYARIRLIQAAHSNNKYSIPPSMTVMHAERSEIFSHPYLPQTIQHVSMSQSDIILKSLQYITLYTN